MAISLGNRKFQIGTDVAGMMTAFVHDPIRLSATTLDENEEAYVPETMTLSMWNSLGTALELNQSQQPTYDYETEQWISTVTFGNVGTAIVRWKSSDNEYGNQMIVVVDARMQYLMYCLRNILDKSIKDQTKTYGFTDVDLFMYLMNGLNHFNSINPMTQFNLGGIPTFIESMVLDVSMLYGLQAQSIHAIDSDVSYNDQGLSLNIDHFNKLETAYTTTYNRVMEVIKRAKWGMSGGGKTAVLAAINPERARNYAIPSQVLTTGFPYFVLPFGSQLITKI